MCDGWLETVVGWQVRKRLKAESTTTGIVEHGPKAGEEMTVQGRVTDRMVTTLTLAFQKLLRRSQAGETMTMLDLLPDDEAAAEDADQFKALAIAVSQFATARCHLAGRAPPPPPCSKHARSMSLVS